MITKKTRKHVLRVGTVLFIILIIFLVINIRELSSNNFDRETHTEEETGIEFTLGKDLEVRGNSHPNEKIKITEIYPATLTNRYMTEIIEIITYPVEKNKDIEDIANDFLQKENQETFSSIGRQDIDSLLYIQTSGTGEQSYYSFLKDNDKFAVAIMRLRHFDTTNPVIMIDNSKYFSEYINIINTINFLD